MKGVVSFESNIQLVLRTGPAIERNVHHSLVSQKLSLCQLGVIVDGSLQGFLLWTYIS